jgi:superfamily II RNA helicase
MTQRMPSRDEIVLEYLERLPYTPYPVQEEAIYAWASSDDGILLSAPTGTGKTLVAEAAVYEGLRTGRGVYYSTPLIALTDQKFLELQDTVARWGFERDRVGLVTGNRTVNPDAQVKVVVAEVLLNRLLHPEAFDGFADVGAVVLDEFHNFNEPQRGIVWELTLNLVPKHVRLMLLSATVGAAGEFVNWMATSLERRLTLVESLDRKVPLHFHWVGDEILPDFLERVARGADAQRRTPALVFCFDRAVCWDTAEVLKGRDLFGEGQRDALLKRLDDFEFAVGSGNKLRTFLTRGVGIHHAGLLPRYRRVVETLFQEKLLPICVCTETLAAGINLPARSVVLTTLVKGPKDKKRLIDSSSARQMFGRAGRPQFDTEGHVFALAHEDDVKLAKWKVKYDSIPEDTKDPTLLVAKKALLKKKPTRRAGVTYWNPEQFTKLQTVPPARLASKGRLTWR